MPACTAGYTYTAWLTFDPTRDREVSYVLSCFDGNTGKRKYNSDSVGDTVWSYDPKSHRCVCSGWTGKCASLPPVFCAHARAANVLPTA